uniref:Rhodopsin n=1 Tax=Heterorhabditis bacteriophora TaxID=37862 RepID=A0A1I7WE72_HETBA
MVMWIIFIYAAEEIKGPESTEQESTI